MTTTTTTDLKVLWSRNMRDDLARKREQARRSLAALKSRGSYYEAHVHLVALYDAAIAAVDAELAVRAP